MSAAGFATPASFVASDIIANAIEERCFGCAARALDSHAAVICDDGLRRLIDAMCASYDHVQLSAEDDINYRRRMLVNLLVGAISRRSALAFVDVNTAIALAFYPESRAAFIEWAVRAPTATLDVIFTDGRYGDIMTTGYRASGHLADLELREIYWGKDSSAHIQRFIAAGRPIYCGVWHNRRQMVVRFNSLVIPDYAETGDRGFATERLRLLATAVERGLVSRDQVSSLVVIPDYCETGGRGTTAERLRLLSTAAERGLVSRDRVSMCAKFYGHAWTGVRVNDGARAARALGTDDWLRPRFCAHFAPHKRDRPLGAVENCAAAEMLLVTLEPLRLPPFVLLEIVAILLDEPDARAATWWHSLFIENCMRVYARARMIRVTRPSKE